jgi:SEC-C motif domain protein
MKDNKQLVAGLCRCGSGKTVENCCALLISGAEQAKSPEQLMHSRFVAYAIGDMGYVKTTWHSSTRPVDVNNLDSMHWLSLEVIDATQEFDKSGQGYVEFKASFVDSSTQEARHGIMHERSRFIIEDGCWRYVDGEQFEPSADSAIKKLGRNEPCFCGSGKKYKKCCAKK